MQYYLINSPGQQPAGPYELSALRQHGLTAASMVWREGLSDWVRAEDCPEVAALIAAPDNDNSAEQATQVNTVSGIDLTKNRDAGSAAAGYYLAVNGQHQGPFTPAQLREHGVMPTSQVWRQGMAAWMPISEIPELSREVFGNNPELYGRSGANGMSQPDSQGGQLDYMSPDNVHPLTECVTECPKNHLALAIVAIIFFWPTGIGALVKSILVKQRWNERRYGDAVWLSRTSRRMSITSIVVSIIVCVVYFTSLASMNLL